MVSYLLVYGATHTEYTLKRQSELPWKKISSVIGSTPRHPVAHRVLHILSKITQIDALATSTSPDLPRCHSYSEMLKHLMEAFPPGIILLCCAAFISLTVQSVSVTQIKLTRSPRP